VRWFSRWRRPSDLKRENAVLREQARLDGLLIYYLAACVRNPRKVSDPRYRWRVWHRDEPTAVYATEKIRRIG
jgi:hypothetical protein